ncbi:heat stress transcription factor B-4-like protein [Tanacetum coccineum]
MEAPPSTVDGHHRATHRTTRIDLWYPGRMYVSGRVDIFDMVDIDLFTVVALNMMVLKLGYTGESEPMFYNYLRPLTSLDEGLYALACEEDVRCMSTLVRSFKLIELSGVHGVDTHSHVLPTIQSQFSDINLSFVSQQATASQVIDDVMRQLSFDETELDGEAGFADVAGSGVDIKTQSELPVFEEPDVGPTQEPILAEVSTQEPIVAEVSTQEPIVAEVSTEAPIVEEVGTQEFSVEDVVIEDYVSSGEDGEDAEQGNGQEDESARTDGEFFHDDEGIDTAYETEYDVQSSEDAGTDDDDDVDEDFLVDEENEIVEPDVDVHLFGISMDLPFDNIGITNLVPDDVLEGEDVDVINVDGFDSDPGNDEERNYRKRRLAELRTEMEGVINASGQWKYSFYTGQKFNTPKEAKDRVYLHSIESRRNLKLYKNDSVRIRARCEGKVHVFTMSQGTGPTGPNRGMEAGPSGLSGPTTRSKKRRMHVPMMTIFEQVRANLDIPIKAVQDLLQRELESINPNTTVKIAVERNTNPSLPTKVFQRIYVCLGALKLGFRACRRDLLGLDGASIKGSFPDQVLVAVGLDSNNRIYPLAYALVEAKSKSSWCWFLQCLGDDIDLHPNSNFTFINDRQKGIIPVIKIVYPSAEHRYCLRHIHENMKKGWYGQAYKDLLWRAASATNVKDFQKCMLELKTMNPKAHEWLNKIPAEHWARSYFSGRAKSDLLLNNICEVFIGKIVEGRDKPVGRPKKKRKRSKHKDEPFVKDGKLSRKGRTITCQSCGNIGHNKATCKGQGRKATTGGNNAEGEGVVGGPGGHDASEGEGVAGVARQGSSRSQVPVT